MIETNEHTSSSFFSFRLLFAFFFFVISFFFIFGHLTFNLLLFQACMYDENKLPYHKINKKNTLKTPNPQTPPWLHFPSTLPRPYAIQAIHAHLVHTTFLSSFSYSSIPRDIPRKIPRKPKNVNIQYNASIHIHLISSHPIPSYLIQPKPSNKTLFHSSPKQGLS